MEPDCEVRNWPSALHPQSRLAASSPLSFKHIPCDASLQQWHGSTWKRSRETWLAGSSEPISSCVLTLFSSFALVCSSCLNGCPCVPSPTANTKTLTSGRQTVKPSKRREQLSSLGLAFRSGVFWVFCGLYANAVPAGCLPCDRAWPAPLLGPTGVELLPCAGLFSPQPRLCHP